MCDGIPPEPAGMIDAPIGPAEGSLTAREVRPDGKPARTHYKVVRTWGSRALVELELETGRTHQIRVHMAYLHHPILGDTVYGAKKPVAGLTGQCLHAVGLRFVHPRSGEVIELSCPLSGEFQALLEKLRRF